MNETAIVGSTAQRRRLLLVVNEAAFFLSHRLPIAQAALVAGYEVHVATPAGPGEQQIREAGLRFHAIPLDRRALNPLRDMRTFSALVRLFRYLKPDLVHTVTIKPVIYGGLAARIAGVPALVSAVSGLGYVFVQRGLFAKGLRLVTRLLYRFAFGHGNARVIVQNPDDRDLLARSGIVRAEATSMIRGSGVDLKRYVMKPESAGEALVVLVSRMLWDKGVREFVHAAQLLKQQGVGARFVLVGDTDQGNPAAIPVTQLTAWQRQGAIEWWGRRDDIPAVLAQAHIVCLPSYREGLPKVLIEAAACGRAIVSTDVPGCREIVRHRENGLLVPARDPESLAQAIRSLLDDAAERRRMGMQGRALAEAEFSAEQVARQTLSLYDELLASGGARAA